MRPDEHMSQFTLYGNPSDYRDKYVIRECHIYGDGRMVPQPEVVLLDDERLARAYGEEHHLGCWLSRMHGDNPAILGCWV